MQEGAQGRAPLRPALAGGSRSLAAAAPRKTAAQTKSLSKTTHLVKHIITTKQNKATFLKVDIDNEQLQRTVMDHGITGVVR